MGYSTGQIGVPLAGQKVGAVHANLSAVTGVDDPRLKSLTTGARRQGRLGEPGGWSKSDIGRGHGCSLSVIVHQNDPLDHRAAGQSQVQLDVG
jgi:hypothetical protein